MLNLDVFLTRLLPSVNGCPEPLARRALIDSAIEFCEETGVVRVTTDSVATQSGTSVYTVDIPTGQLVVNVQRAWYGSRELTAAPDSQVANVQAYISEAATDIGQEPIYFIEFMPGEVTLFPTPGASANGELVFRASTKPARSATSVENVLYEDWVEPIVSGALARLHATPDTPFFSASAAGYQASLFRLGINRARSEALRGRVRTSISVAPRAFC
jgi:hypothetical protein